MAGPNGKFGQDPAKREERRQRMLKRFDANGDGVLDDAEKDKFRPLGRSAERKGKRREWADEVVVLPVRDWAPASVDLDRERDWGLSVVLAHQRAAAHQE